MEAIAKKTMILIERKQKQHLVGRIVTPVPQGAWLA